ncbi:MAG: cyclic nucleotide-binding domain-containing protein [Dermatophilaceae bacterium]
MTANTFDEIVTAIHDAPIGSFVGRHGAEVLARFAGDEVPLADGELLFHKGDYASTFYFVTSGRLAFVREASKNRPQLIIHVLEKGDLVGELSFIDGSQYTVSCAALGPATVLSFRVGDLSPLIDDHPRVLYDFMRAIIARVHASRASISRQQQELADYIATAGKRF